MIKEVFKRKIYKRTEKQKESTKKNLRPHPENMRHDYWKGKKRLDMIKNKWGFVKGDKRLMGENNSRWSGGKEKAYKNRLKSHRAKFYGLTFQQLERKIIEGCEICNWKLNIDIHHIDGNKKNNLKENLIGLCPNCHALIHRLKLTIEEIKMIYEQS